ncbi:hypothetical protein EP47_07750 [Legionella norrlandica]|uniref:Ankyrin n=1 Tax=Legionella norrlandica TaxID=1498499 RepID=A0A0A2T670_9GAMM|nr:hypothetical protein [Legionella norrlandica]KGP62888.1 hypothetical protein EP47_07750 [Legionella norrlandica]
MLSEEEQQFIELVLQQFQQFLESYEPTPITNYASLKDAVAIKELVESCMKLKELMKHPETFKTEFLNYFHQRKKLLANTSLSFTALPLGSANQIYWELVQHLFQPKTLNEMLAIIMPHVKGVRSIGVKEQVPSYMSIDDFVQTPPFFIQEQSLAEHPLAQNSCPYHLGSYVILDDYLFFLEEIASLPFHYHQQIYILLKEQYPELAAKIYSHNHEWEVLEQDILLSFGQSPREALSALCKGLILGGERITGQLYAGESAQQSCKRFTIYWNHLSSEFKQQLNQLQDAHGAPLSEILHVLLERGGCVETAAAQLKSLLDRAENAELLDIACHIQPEAKAAIALKYSPERNPQGIFTDGHEVIDTLPEPYLSKSLAQINLHSLDDFLSVLIKFPTNFYATLLSSIQFKDASIFEKLALLTEEHILSPEQSSALSNAIENHLLNINAVLIYAIATGQSTLFEKKLTALPPDEAKKVLETRDQRGNTLLHRLASKPEFLHIILKLYSSPEERMRILQIPGIAGQTIVHRAMHHLPALQILLSACPTDEFKLKLFTCNRSMKPILIEAACSPEALTALLQSFPNPENRLKAIQTPLYKGEPLLHLDDVLTRPQCIQAILNTLPPQLVPKAIGLKSAQELDAFQKAIKNLERYKEAVNVLLHAIEPGKQWSFLLPRCISEVLPPPSALDRGLQWDATTIRAFNEMKRLMENNLLSPETIQSWSEAFVEMPKEKDSSPYRFFTINQQGVLNKILGVIRCYVPDPHVQLEEQVNPGYR